jgi:hypothetical protein
MATIGDLLVGQFFRATLTTSITAASGTTDVFVSSVEGYPTPTGNEYFYLTLVDGDVAEVVKIGAVDVGNKKLTLFGTTTVQLGFNAQSSRAELWFTAEAFEDIQEYLTDLATSSYPGVDDSTIEADTTLRVKLLGILAGHLADGAVIRDKLFDNAVNRDKIADGEVFNVALATGIDASKITTGLFSRALLKTALARTTPGDETTAALSFDHIRYVEQSLDAGVPSGGVEGDIVIEFES